MRIPPPPAGVVKAFIVLFAICAAALAHING
jgi:hypothetical protein